MTNDRIIVLKWYDHFGDKYLEEDYDRMQAEFNKHPGIKTLYDSDKVGVFSYPDSATKALGEFHDSLFEPRYYENIEEMAEEYEEDPSDMEALFAAVDYQEELIDIGKLAGCDEREFDRLWTERFVFGNDYSLSY